MISLVAVLAVAVCQATITQESPASADRQAGNPFATTQQPPQTAESTSTSAASTPAEGSIPPAWLLDSSWYYIDVPRFRNRTNENDPPATRPWNQPLVPPGASREELFRTGDIPYGGDLQGVRAKLNYIRDLGVNTICLSCVFADDLDWQRPLGDAWHVREEISSKNRNALAPGRPESKTRWTEGDRLLLQLIREAHAQKMKVVISIPAYLGRDRGQPHKLPEHWRPRLTALEAVPHLARWHRPPPDVGIADGVDGYLISADKECPSEVSASFAAAAKEAMSGAVVVGRIDDHFANTFPRLAGVSLSGLVGGGTISPYPGGFSYAGGLRFAEAKIEAVSGRGTRILVNELSSTYFGRMATHAQIGLELVSDAETRLRVLQAWRLGFAVAMCFPGAPMIMYGDEVGMTGEHADASLSPMWWLDPGAAEPPSSSYRADFCALVRLMNRIRAAHEPLRRGDFHILFADDERRLMAFSRATPIRRIIVAINASTARQDVEIDVGTPGRMVGILCPELGPMIVGDQLPSSDPTKPVVAEPTLRCASDRAIVDGEGKVRIDLDSMSLKLVLVGYSVND